MSSAAVVTLDPCEASLVPDLPPRLVGCRPAGAAVRRALLATPGAAVRELRRADGTLVRVHLVSAEASLLDRGPSWEAVSDGGLGRSADPAGEVDWVIGLFASPELLDADVAAALPRLVPDPGRPGRGFVIPVLPAAESLVRGALSGTLTRPLRDHVPGPDGRLDAVAIVRPSARSRPPLDAPTLRVAALQLALRADTSVDASLARWQAHIAAAAAAGAELVVMPEMPTTEWLVHGRDASLHAAVRTVDTHREAYLAAMADAARGAAVTLVAGSHFERDGDDLVNRARVFGPDGQQVAVVEKLHPTPYEAEVYGVVPGRRADTFTVRGVRCAVAICYDVEFPETARAARGAGAEVLLVPFNTEASAGFHRIDRCASARAVESEGYVVTCGAVGRFTHPFDVETHEASSAAFAPSDRGFPSDGVLARAAAGAETTLHVELDLARLRALERASDVRPYRDR